jgi:TolB protein
LTLRDIANPYRPGEPVTEPAMLFGRQEAADWLELQITGGARTVVLNGAPLIGKTSFVKHVGAIQSLQAYNLLVSLIDTQPLVEELDKQQSKETKSPTTINTVLQAVIDQLTPQLLLLDLISPEPTEPLSQTASELRKLFAQANKRLGPERLVLFFDDLHLLFTDDMAIAAGFLTSLIPLLDECPQLHIVFTLSQDKLQGMEHPLLDGAPVFNLGPLATDAALNMVTLPVKDILHFDYGVTKRIVAVNSHHPYYLSLFCHTLLNRQVHDGWVNQRDFDSALGEVLDSPIETFTQIWDEAIWVERAVLSGMAAIQGTHGPLTDQEITRFLQRHNSAVTSQVVVRSLDALAERRVLVPMGAISYRFHVELLRLWLQEHTDLSEIIREVNWDRLAAQAKPSPKPKASTPSLITHRKEKPQRRRNFLWPIIIVLLVGLCTLTAGAVFATRYIELPLFFLAEPTSTVAAIVPKSQEVVTDTTPTATSAPLEPTPTATPTPPAVVARALPSITYMGRDIDQSWRIYVMNADGSDVTALSLEGMEDTSPVWSPDGQKIAFVSQRDGNREIYVMNADGQNVVNITRHPADDWTPAWSPDGSQLAFSSLRTGGWEIYVVETTCLDAPETCPDRLTQITNDDNANILPVWSPDGSRFVFNSKASGNWDIYTMTTDGTDIRQITVAPENDLAPTWSPDGSQIAFESNRDGNVEVYVINADGTGTPRNITNLFGANDHGPAWTPDGQQLVFYSNREGNWDIFATSLDGETVTNLTQSPERDEQTPAWRP